MKINKRVKIILRIISLLLACLLLVGCSNSDSDNDGGDDGFYKSTSAGANKKPASNKKRVALTFDDGPHNVRTEKIVDELAKYGFNATFFVVGSRVAEVEDRDLQYDGAKALSYAVEKGNEIGIHGYTHAVYYNKCEESVYKSELADTEAAIKSVVKNYKVKLMRPIGGAITDERVASCPYAVIMWSVDSEDWKYRSASDEETAKQNIDTIVENVMFEVSDGDIILMHDLYDNTYEATKIILKQLHEQGYEVVTVSELLGTVKTGQKYSQAPAKSKETEGK